MSGLSRRSSSSIFGVLPAGTVLPFAGENAPAGWAICDGSTLLRADYQELFAAMGTIHGEGDGSTTFHLPDYRGRFLRGADNGAGRDPDAATRTAANSGGATGDSVGSVQDDAMQGHRHSNRDNRDSTQASPGSLPMAGTFDRGRSPYTGIVLDPVDDGVNGAPRISSETRNKNANINYIIKL
jgi:microcystin-dependent protein